MDYKPNKLFDSNWDNIDIGQERTRNTEISVLPLVSDMYEESTTNDMDTLLSRKMIEKELYDIYLSSPFFDKYGDELKKIEKKEIPEVYYYFRDELKKLNHNKVEILCAICEFFDFNYSNMYNNVLSLEEKSNILEILENDYGLQNKFKHSKKLF